jgi:hypothetical protein
MTSFIAAFSSSAALLFPCCFMRFPWIASFAGGKDDPRNHTKHYEMRPPHRTLSGSVMVSGGQKSTRKEDLRVPML